MKAEFIIIFETPKLQYRMNIYTSTLTQVRFLLSSLKLLNYQTDNTYETFFYCPNCWIRLLQTLSRVVQCKTRYVYIISRSGHLISN